MNHKKTTYKGLQFVPVWFEDRSLTSPDYFQISEFPNKLTAGKNLFKLRGHPTNIRVNSVLNIEILDYNQDPIYFEALSYLDDDKSRIIAIYIYDDTAAGDCTITIMAEAEDVPENWKGLTNIRWTRTVSVNPQISNDSEIIFESIPELSITEQIGPHLDRIYSGSIQFPTFTDGTVKYFSYNGQPAIELSGSKFTKDMSNGAITINTPINPSPTAVYTPNTIKYTSGIKKVLSPTLALLDTEYEVYTSSSLSSHIYYSFDPSTFSLTYEATPTYTQTQNSESYALFEIKGLQPSTGDVSRIKLFMNNKGTVGTWEMINDIELTETEIFVANTASLYPDTSIGLFMSQSIIDNYWEGHTYQGFTETTAPALTWNTASLNNALQIVNSTNISAKNAVSVAQIKSSYNGLFIEKSDYKITFDAIGTKNTYDNAILSVYISGSAFSMDYTDYLNQELPKYLGKRIGQLTIDNSNQRFDDKVFSFTADKTGTATLLFVVESGDWQIADIRTTSDNEIGYTPTYTRIKTLVPTAHKSNNQVSFKTEYYNVAGVKSKQISYTYNKTWEGGNRYIDGNYSMLTGSLYVADSLNSGVAISGYKNTGFIRSLGYEGFTAATPGFLLWSGSAMSGSLGTKGGVTYSGVGLELYADNNNYLRYSTTDSELDIHTDNIFIGNSTSFISASNGNILISGSNVSVNSEKFFFGNQSNFISGSGGNIKISGSNVAVTTPTFFFGNNSNFISGSGGNIKISGSNVSVETPTFFFGNNSNFISGSGGNIKISGSNVLVTTPTFLLGNQSSFISGSSNGNIKISGSNVSVETPTFLLGNTLNFISGSNGNIRISGSNVAVTTPTFFLGNNSNFISGSNGNIKISGSNVSVETPTFFLGNQTTQYISGSNGILQISSSNFHLKANGQITASGIDIAGVSQANVIQNKTIVITTANSGSYIQTIPEVDTALTFTAAHQILVLDGSLGGQVVQRVKLDFNSPIQPSHTSTFLGSITSYPIAIGGIKLPNISNASNVTCYVETANGRTIYMNNSVGSFNMWYSSSIPGWGNTGSGWLQDTAYATEFVGGSPGYDGWWY